MRRQLFSARSSATHFALPHIVQSKGDRWWHQQLDGQKKGIPSYALYGASKFAIQGLYEALRLELEPEGVHVGLVSPAFVDTPLRSNVLAADGKPWPEPPQPPFRVRPVGKVVDRIVRLLVRRQREALIPGWRGRCWSWTSSSALARDRILRRRFPPDGG